MASSIRYEIRLAKTLTPDERRAIEGLVQQTGFQFQEGYLEAVHYAHNPQVVLAWRAEQLVGFQSFTPYGQIQTPFSAVPIWFVYGELAFQDKSAAGQGIGYRLTTTFMRQWLGPLWFLRRYAFMTRSPNPRLMQLVSMQHRLFLPDSPALTPAMIAFAQTFVRDVRRLPQPVTDQLVVEFPPTDTPPDITTQWPRMYQARDDRFNQLAFRLGLIERRGDRYVMPGHRLLILGRSSKRQLAKSVLSGLFRPRKTATSAAQSQAGAPGTAPAT